MNPEEPNEQLSQDTSITAIKIDRIPAPPRLMVGRQSDLEALKKRVLPTATERDSGLIHFDRELLKEARTRQGLTQRDVANSTKINIKTIKNAEKGRGMHRPTATAIAGALNTKLEKLVRSANPSDFQSQALTVIRGLPGVGKTALLRALVHDPDIAESFPIRLWASLGQEANPLSIMAAWARVLQIHDQIDWSVPEPSKRLDNAHNALAGYLSDKRALLIVDDAWHPQDAEALMVGGSQCYSFVTTRIATVAERISPSIDDTYILKALDETGAIALLDRLTSTVNEHQEAAVSLVNRLGRLPLALLVAGHLLRAEIRNGLDVTKLFRDLCDATALLEEEAPIDMGPGPTAPPTVGALLRKSTDLLPESARKCFAYLAAYATQPNSFSLPALESSWSPLGVDVKAMLNLLTARGLLEPIGSGRYWLHSLLAAHAKTILAGSPEPYLLHAQYYGAIAENCNTEMENNNALVGVAVMDYERANILAGWTWARQSSHENEKAAELCIEYLFSSVNYFTLNFEPEMLIDWCDHALSLVGILAEREGTSPGDVEDIEVTIDGFKASAHYSAGRYHEAKELYKRRVAVFEKKYPNDVRFATALNDLACLYELEGREGEAALMLQLAIAIYESDISTSNHKDQETVEHNLATALQNLGRLYLKRGYLEKARQLLNRALNLRKITTTSFHPDLITNLALIAECEIAAGEYEEAESLLHQLVTLESTISPRRHPRVGHTQYLFGQLYNKQARYKDAVDSFERALDAWQDRLPKDHPDVQNCREALAKIDRFQGRSADAPEDGRE